MDIGRIHKRLVYRDRIPQDIQATVTLVLNTLMPVFCTSHSITSLPLKVAHKLPVQEAGRILSFEVDLKCIVALVFFGLQF